MKDKSDTILIKALRNKEAWIAKYFCDRYLPIIRLLVFQNGGSNEDASYVFQEALIVLMEKSEDEKFELHCKLKTLFYCIAESIWKEYLDSKKNKITKASCKLDIPFEDYQLNSDEYQAMLKMEYDNININLNDLELVLGEYFKTLDKTSRNLLSLYWGGMSIIEIANVLNIKKEDYAKQAIMLAKEELVQRLKKDIWYSRLPEQIANEG